MVSDGLTTRSVQALLVATSTFNPCPAWICGLGLVLLQEVGDKSLHPDMPMRRGGEGQERRPISLHFGLLNSSKSALLICTNSVRLMVAPRSLTDRATGASWFGGGGEASGRRGFRPWKGLLKGLGPREAPRRVAPRVGAWRAHRIWPTCS